MIPGTQSKVSESVVASADVIQVKSDLARITGATAINTVLSPLMGSAMITFLVPVDGNIVLGTTGNILVGATLIVNRVYMLIWSKTLNKWYIHGVV